ADTWMAPELLGGLALARAALASVHADAPRTIAMCRRALAHLPEESLVLRALANSYLGTAHWQLGEAAAADRAGRRSLALSEAAGNIYQALTSAVMLGHGQVALGELHGAAQTYERALLRAAEYGAPSSVALAHAGLAEVLLEWNELEGASRHAVQAIEL